MPLLVGTALAASGKIFDPRLMVMRLGTVFSDGAVMSFGPHGVTAIAVGRVVLLRGLLLVGLLVEVEVVLLVQCGDHGAHRLHDLSNPHCLHHGDHGAHRLHDLSNPWCR